MSRAIRYDKRGDGAGKAEHIELRIMSRSDSSEVKENGKNETERSRVII